MVKETAAEGKASHDSKPNYRTKIETVYLTFFQRHDLAH